MQVAKTVVVTKPHVSCHNRKLPVTCLDGVLDLLLKIVGDVISVSDVPDAGEGR